MAPRLILILTLLCIHSLPKLAATPARCRIAHLTPGFFPASEIAPQALAACKCANSQHSFRSVTHEQKRFAVASILHSNGEKYACGAVMMAEQAKKYLNMSQVDLVLLLTTNTIHLREDMESVGWKVYEVPTIASPKRTNTSSAYNQLNWSKMNYWTLVEYEGVLAMDADVLIARDVSWVFQIEGIAAYSEHNNEFPTYFNAGLMKIAPSLCTFAYLVGNHTMDVTPIAPLAANSAGDQPYINMYFYKFKVPMTFLGDVETAGKKSLVASIFQDVTLVKQVLDSPESASKAIDFYHFFYTKPWVCRSAERDCNHFKELPDPEHYKRAQTYLFQKFWEAFKAISARGQKVCYKFGAPKLKIGRGRPEEAYMWSALRYKLRRMGTSVIASTRT